MIITLYNENNRYIAMKKYSFIFIFAFIASVTTTYAQLLDTLVGKWNVKEYRNNQTTVLDSGFIDFQQDGVFESRGTYFGTRKGLYRTDETRSVVLIDNGKTTEWKATMTNNVLKLDQIIKKQRKPKIYMILIKEGKDENQQVIN